LIGGFRKFWHGSIEHRPDMSHIRPILANFPVTEHEIRDRLNTTRKMGVGLLK
jgi:hypothetical protein